MSDLPKISRKAGRIAILPPELANQIAAGEVVERPSSVVKELVENSVDAGATQVDVTVEGGGRTLLTVRDDGEGMGREEARLCLERHATSKIQTARDLFAISSLGFRGEALPSIASVSRLTLTTRREEDMEGTAVTVAGGQFQSIRPVACPVGTEVAVRDLFFNTPARLKFLKTEKTERRHITDTLIRLALGQSHLYVRLLSEGKTLIDAPPTIDLRDRAGAVLGPRIAKHLYPIEAIEGYGDVIVSGLFGSPNAAKRNSSGIHTFVNHRFVRDRKIQAAISMAYAGLLGKGLYPLVVLYLDLPPETVDVNVHPTKVEVRFNQPDLIFRAVRRALLNSLAATPWVPRSQKGAVRSYTLKEAGASTLPMTGVGPDGKGIGDLARPYRPVLLKSADGIQQTLPGTQRVTLPESSMGGWWSSGPLDRASPEETLASGQYFSSLAYLGQLGSTYLLCQDEAGLVMVDQHAAHERITFERLKDIYAGHHRQIQTLLLPVQIELDGSQQATFEEFGSFFSSCGFEIEPFSSGTYVIRAVPAVLVGTHYDRLIYEALDEIAQTGQSQRLDEAMEAVLSRMACHGSVRGGDKMSPEEVRALFVQMDNIDFRANCPHGRPVFFRMSWSEIEKRFDRQ